MNIKEKLEEKEFCVNIVTGTETQEAKTVSGFPLGIEKSIITSAHSERVIKTADALKIFEEEIATRDRVIQDLSKSYHAIGIVRDNLEKTNAAQSERISQLLTDFMEFLDRIEELQIKIQNLENKKNEIL